MAKSIFNQLSEAEKLEIIDYYLAPNSAKDTLTKFNLQNRRDLDRILAEKHINKHAQEVQTFLRLNKTCVCEICGKTICLSNLPQHRLAHENKTFDIAKNRQSVQHEGLNCIYCGKECKNKNSLAQHECRCSKNPKKYNTTNNLSNCGWAKGLSAKTDERIRHQQEAVKKYYLNPDHHGSFLGKKHTEESKKLISIQAIENKYQTHFGVHKLFKYKDTSFQSSYEVIVAKSLDENNVKWIKPSYGCFKYRDINNKLHTYTPDFYLPDYNIYLDPKNDYLISHINPTLGYCDVDKINWVMEQNNVKILILNKNQLSWDIIASLI